MKEHLYKSDTELLLFNLQMLGIMMVAGRDEEADGAYQTALQLAEKLVEEENK